jgi:hypothetical protein
MAAAQMTEDQAVARGLSVEVAVELRKRSEDGSIWQATRHQDNSRS